MKRIWEAAAYGPGPVERCWWAETVTPDPWPALDGDVTTDIAVIGGGFTGLSAALHLAEGGAQVTVLEANSPYWGASGRNGGFCCLGGARMSNATLTRRFGPEGRRDWRRAERGAIELVDSLLDRHGIDVDRHSEGETLLAHRRRDWEAMQEEAASVEADYGVSPTLIPQGQLARHGLSGPFHGAMTTPLGFALNPRKYAEGLARAAHGAGATLHAETPVTRIEGEGPYRLVTPNGTVTAKRIIVATNGYSSEDIPPFLAGRYLPMQSSVLVTRPLTEPEREAQGWTSHQMAYDTRRLLHYFRLMPDNRMLFGMRGGLSATPGAEAAIRKKIRADFETMFPAWKEVETPNYWSGFVCMSRNLTPFAGPVPGMRDAFAGLCYHGNGVAMGSFTGRLLADLALDRKPDLYPAAMAARPGRFPLGRFRRLLQRPAYAFYALRDL
ncbi:FAD-dependent oxidoreductase [Aquicoccus sp. SCR17]|nr:FAD-dependent oxidoreductase [Carideicomes alvinocaridis]